MSDRPEPQDEPMEAELVADDPLAALGGLGDALGGVDLNSLMAGFQAVQDARSQTYEGSSGGGAVVISATGDMEFQRIRIDRSVVVPEEVDLLEDLVLAALRDLTTNMMQAQQSAMGGGGGMDLANLDLGDLFGGALGATDGDEEE